jgi:hypothetical protein
MKLRIEGEEAELFSGNLSWMNRIKAMIIEFHPGLVDAHQIIENQSFQYTPTIPEFGMGMVQAVGCSALRTGWPVSPSSHSSRCGC